jgi:hypothetical protein
LFTLEAVEAVAMATLALVEAEVAVKAAQVIPV